MPATRPTGQQPDLCVVYWVLVERAVTGLQALRPLGCSIYERCFWRHERFWKVPARRLADELAVPLSSVLLAAHAKVLAALSGEREVATGYVAADG
ncbi:MAG: hypothetical protein LC799_33190, partial [Actinobacteria bacterium]|nr:hypothetical protein [Actinomycetota bacterium]